MERPQRQVLSAIIPVGLVILGIALWQWYQASRGQRPQKATTTISENEIPDVPLHDLATWCVQRWAGNTAPAPASLQSPAEAVYLAARQDGVLLTRAWGDGTTLGGALEDAIAKLGNASRSATALELFVVTDSEVLDAAKATPRLLSNIHRGIVGIEEVRGATNVVRHSPTEVLASNRSHRKMLGLAANGSAPTDVAFRLLYGKQILVDIGAGTASTMERGNTLVGLGSVTEPSIKNFSERLATWMWANLHANGRMTYLYWPSQGREAPGRDNLIRQFMATIALGRVAALRSDAALLERSASNIDYNLGAYFAQEGDLGIVRLHDKVKLGAVALAALAIAEHPRSSRWKTQEAALLRTVDSLWQDDGAFRTFHSPSDRNDNQNFYPGEALLLWATKIANEPDSELLARFMKSFSFYRAWHLDPSEPGRRNPAFVPWHTQAYFLVWKQTKNTELRDFIFEMNDWLLKVQQWDTAQYSDTRGRFYSPDHDYGPPHASATGVYLEGLADAFSLALLVGDTSRTKKYSEAIRRGLRSSQQLQFTDDIDMFYVSKRDRVFGGLRTTVYDNQIRCDNVQHTLMATLKILESGALPAAH